MITVKILGDDYFAGFYTAEEVGSRKYHRVSMLQYPGLSYGDIIIIKGV